MNRGSNQDIHLSLQQMVSVLNQETSTYLRVPGIKTLPPERLCSRSPLSVRLFKHDLDFLHRSTRSPFPSRQRESPDRCSTPAVRESRPPRCDREFSITTTEWFRGSVRKSNVLSAIWRFLTRTILSLQTNCAKSCVMET